ncbi:MAG: helix-turn-helix transcriptional regulator [Ruminococcus sp.]|nr:helix-turn-helix transcriptional regulator [Ruminococcus sp.]
MRIIDFKAMGARIRSQRELLGYTREQLAERLEVSSKFCSDIELGIKGMSLNTLAKLSDILHLSTDFILFGEQDADAAKADALLQMINQCPPCHRGELTVIIQAFLKAVSDES